MRPPIAPSPDPRLLQAQEQARDAASAEAGEHPVGSHVGVEPEDGALTHLFAADLPGYRGWRWAVTLAASTAHDPVTVSEVVLLPGPDALVAPAWLPWSDRVRPGDLGVGDLLPPAQDDPRLVPGYLALDDAAAESLTPEPGLGRQHALSREGRADAAQRWHDGDLGPDSDMARSAPGTCVSCGFYLPLAGSLAAAFGACGNEFAPADGRVVHAEYGCGAHSEVSDDFPAQAAVPDLVYDDSRLEITTADDAATANSGA